ncbi:MAG TPA: PAS domain-containing sensor histidine kinase [Ramlibacter sp.]|nr:PAS domain-containing sensor histidine kinase [Ramlibacter sp.]
MESRPLPGAEALYHGAPCGLLLAASDGLIVSVNETACRWLGYTPVELESRLRWPDLLTVGGRIFHQTHLAPLLRMQGSVAEVKLDLRHKAGHTLPMMMNAVERGAGVDMMLHVALFIAEDRHKYERELLLERRRAEEIARFAEQMMGIVSHDLRNPLNVIVMSTFVLERAELTAPQRTVLSRITQSARHAQRLINDLLDFTQTQLGKGLSLHASQLALHEVVAEAVASLRIAFPQHRIEHVARGEGACRADGDRIAQLIGNLIGNAAAYGDRGLPITVTSSVSGGECEIAVHNHGPAIPADLQPRLFEPMVRGAQHSSGGVGLGLYIVRQIAKAHGGEVSVASADPAGTTFTVRLPAS